MEKIRVIQIVSKLNFGGAEIRTIELINQMNLDIFSFEFVVHSAEIGVLERELESKGIAVHHFHEPTLRNALSLLIQISKFYKHNTIDVIHNHNTTYGVFHHLFAKISGIPIRIAHARSEQHGIGFKNLFRISLSFFIKYLATHRVAVSQASGRLIFGKKPFTVLPNGVDYSKYYFDELGRSEIRKQLGINKEDILFGHIGRLSLEKNHSFIIDLFSYLSKDFPNSHLVIVGAGPIREFILDRVENLDLSDKFHLIESLPNSKDFLSAIDLLLFPSLYEGMPGVVIESQLCKCPSIISETVTDEVVFSPLVRRMPLNVNLWRDEILTKNWRKSIRHKEMLYSNHFDLSNTVNYFSTIYTGRSK
jgi:glycosyltransferase involved in cell wall biosynthesis